MGSHQRRSTGATWRFFAIISMFVSCLLPTTDASAIQGGARCTRPYVGGEIYNFGIVNPGQEIVLTLPISCVMSFTYPFSMNISHLSGYDSSAGLVGPAAHSITVHGVQVPEGGFGTSGSVCPLGGCGALMQNTRFNSNVIFRLNAGQQPGNYVFRLKIFGTHRPNVQYSDEVNIGVIKYVVRSPACALTSGGSKALDFGDFVNTVTSSKVQVANINFSCTSDAQVTAKLIANQSVVNSASGISATTLNGLSMVSKWSDTDSPVDLGGTRSFSFRTGMNTLGIKFQLRLNNSGTPPVGKFSSQYTLVIDYL